MVPGPLIGTEEHTLVLPTATWVVHFAREQADEEASAVPRAKETSLSGALSFARRLTALKTQRKEQSRKEHAFEPACLRLFSLALQLMVVTPLGGYVHRLDVCDSGTPNNLECGNLQG